MKIVEKYIAKNVLLAIGMVTMLLVGLQFFILFVGQIDNIGKGNFGMLAVLSFVGLQLPYQVYLFFPVACLLGCLIGLGILANNSELIVLRAAGFSINQITAAVLKSALILIILVTLLGETIIPKLVNTAESFKADQISNGQTLVTSKGVWLRSGNSFINIGTVVSHYKLLNIFQYQFDAKHELILARSIAQAEFNQGIWNLHEVKESHFADEQIIKQQFSSSTWDIALDPNMLSIVSNEPEDMTLIQLHQYIKLQHQNKQIAGNYEYALWKRVLQPFTTMVMVLLAIPFIFGPLRSATMGSKIITGATVGFGFHMLNGFFGPLSQVYQFSPVIGAILPTLFFAGLAWWMMRKI